MANLLLLSLFQLTLGLSVEENSMIKLRFDNREAKTSNNKLSKSEIKKITIIYVS